MCGSVCEYVRGCVCKTAGLGPTGLTAAQGMNLKQETHRLDDVV